jgi:hypothetical protein
VDSRFSQTPGNESSGAGETFERPAADAPAASGGIGGVVANVGVRVQEILDIAERVASDIRAEAEVAGARQVAESRREADRVVDERIGELASLTRPLSARVEAVEREARALITELDGARERLARFGSQPVAGLDRPDGAPAPPEDGPVPVPEPVSAPDSVTVPGSAPEASPGPEASPAPDRNQIPEQAILRATQMAVAGVERTEIEHMLRSEFGVDDAMSVVDKMLLSERA